MMTIATIVSARRARIVTFVVSTVFVAGVLLEGLVALLLAHTPRWPRLRSVARDFYATFDRSVIQMDPRFSRYDPELLYTLRPGRFEFANREFRTAYRVNSLGVRDDETALVAPEVVVLGDSIAMGWGVEQDETFPKLVARATGLRVLNAAVSSYGTVREMRLLDRVDTTALRYLVIQYNANDFDENVEYRLHGNHYVPSSRERFREVRATYQAQRRYYPGTYAVEAVKLFWADLKHRVHLAAMPTAPSGTSATETADLFINAVLHAGSKDLSRVKLIVYEFVGEGEDPVLFPSLRERLTKDPPPLRDATLVAPRLEAEDFFVLDDHPNRRGHRVIADAIAAAIRR